MSHAFGLESPAPQLATLRLRRGVEITIDPVDRLIWLDSRSTGISLTFGIDALADAGFSDSENTLAIALNSGLSFIEVSCTRSQAEDLFKITGWGLDRLTRSDDLTVD